MTPGTNTLLLSLGFLAMITALNFALFALIH